MVDSYLSIELSDEIPKSITCKEILTKVSQCKSMPQRIDIQGYTLTIRHMPLSRPIYKLFESNNLNHDSVSCKIDDLSSSFMGTLYIDLLAPTEQS